MNIRKDVLMISNISPNKLKATPEVVGGVGDLVSNSGTQYYQQDRVYSSEGIAMCHPSGLSSGVICI